MCSVQGTGAVAGMAAEHAPCSSQLTSVAGALASTGVVDSAVETGMMEEGFLLWQFCKFSLSLVIAFLCFSGLQEYVEAVSFQHFIKTRSLISMDEINKELVFTTEDSGKENKTVRI